MMTRLPSAFSAHNLGYLLIHNALRSQMIFRNFVWLNHWAARPD